ncbi:hypothetical protein CCP3SC1_2420001 [Gammaproteobacteria bacterium]
MCGMCGGAVVATSAGAYGRAARKDRGPSVCAGVMVPRELADKLLVGELRNMLLSPSSTEETQREVSWILSDEQVRADAVSISAKARLSSLDEEIKRLVDAIVKIGISDALERRLAEEEGGGGTKKRFDLQSNVRRKTPSLTTVYRKLVMDLLDALQDDVHKFREILKVLLGHILTFALVTIKYGNLIHSQPPPQAWRGQYIA